MKPKTRRVMTRAVLPAALAAATAVGSHVMLREAYGPSYLKRAPMAGRMFQDPHELDFYLSRHMVSADLKDLDGILESAKRGGKPYNVMIVEGAHITPVERHAYELRAKKWTQQISEETAKMRAAGSEMRVLEAEMKGPGAPKDTADRYAAAKKRFEASRANLDLLDQREAYEDARVQEHYDKGGKMAFRESGSDGFSLRQHKLAAKYDLPIKVAEEWGPGEAQEMKGLLRDALTPPEGLGFEQQREYFVGRFAEYLRRRNENIQRMVNVVEGEMKLPKMRAIVVMGSEHDNTAEFLDRNLMSKVRVVYGSTRTTPQRQYATFYRDVTRAKELARKPLKDIKAYQREVTNRVERVPIRRR